MEKPGPAFLEKEFEKYDRHVLISDIDGTLAPFGNKRDEVDLWPGVREILDEINDSDKGSLVFVTGREARDGLRILGLEKPVEIWGVHGWERLDRDGKLERFEPDPGRTRAIHLLFKDAMESLPAERVEKKFSSVAIHWRGISRKEKSIIDAWLKEKATAFAEAEGLDVLPFDKGVEFRVPGRDKGLVVKEVLEKHGESVLPAYLGDDKTDENAFEALPGHGISVLVRKKARPSKARFYLEPPGDLLVFLETWLECLKKS